MPGLCQAFSSIMGELLVCFKHPGFREEREWRLVHVTSVMPAMGVGFLLAQLARVNGVGRLTSLGGPVAHGFVSGDTLALAPP